MGMGEKGVGTWFTFRVCVCVKHSTNSYGHIVKRQRFSLIQQTGEARD